MTFVGHAHVHDEFSPLDGAGNAQPAQQGGRQERSDSSGLHQPRKARLGARSHPCLPASRSSRRSRRSLGDQAQQGRALIPIVGIEAFWRPDRFMDLTDKTLYGKNGHNWAQHLCVHAGSLRGLEDAHATVLEVVGQAREGRRLLRQALLRLGHARERSRRHPDLDGVHWPRRSRSSSSHEDEEGAQEWLERAVSIVGRKERLPRDHASRS
jgi:hypothetical protein